MTSSTRKDRKKTEEAGYVLYEGNARILFLVYPQVSEIFVRFFSVKIFFDR